MVGTRSWLSVGSWLRAVLGVSTGPRLRAVPALPLDTRLCLGSWPFPVSGLAAGSGLSFDTMLRNTFRLRTGPRPCAVLGLCAVPGLRSGSRLCRARRLGSGLGLTVGTGLRGVFSVRSGPHGRAVHRMRSGLGLCSGTEQMRSRPELRLVPVLGSGAQVSGSAWRAVPGVRHVLGLRPSPRLRAVRPLGPGSQLRLRPMSGLRSSSGIRRGGRRPEQSLAVRGRNPLSRSGIGHSVRTHQRAPEQTVHSGITRPHRRRQGRNPRRRRTVRLDVQPVHIVARLVLSRVALLRRDRIPARSNYIRDGSLELRRRARRRRDRLRLPSQRSAEFPQPTEEVADTAHRRVRRGAFPPLVDRPL
ncbi:hypothetical protein [Nocardia bhagyanarayanae]|uniref:hypothetical protein n=1 Tax=Nocardia bhagyanarayanae TaxID=1215925 RepID=UPI00163B2E96|nr:hypothetical protein [Nocardia bhagyanarayanae]